MMFSLRPQILIALLLTCSGLVVADVYQWKDDKGVTHFGDKPPAKKPQNKQPPKVEKIVLRSTRIFTHVKNQTPIKYKGKQKAPLVLFKELLVELKKSNQKDLHIGTRTTSNRGTCTHPQPIIWDQGYLNVSESSLMSDVIVAFKEADYRMITGNLVTVSNDASRLVLAASITHLRIDLCDAYSGSKNVQQKAAAYVKVNWRLSDRLSKKVLHQSATEGAFNGFDRYRREGGEKAIFRAITNAARNLLANENFVDHLVPLSSGDIEKQTYSKLNIALRYGIGDATFRQKVKSLNTAAVTVRTVKGHGSGVVLDRSGYILTNAHVVGDETNVIVIVNNQEIRGHVIRKDSYRDVALIKVKEMKSVNSAVISKSTLTEGDTIYVIGTPLDEALSNTVTKGVFSAHRQINGLSYYQTDAAINPGNSGGPVFDQTGELVAISVAGVFTRDGASLNVNYLIPIESAIARLNITKPRDISHLFEVSGASEEKTQTPSTENEKAQEKTSTPSEEIKTKPKSIPPLNSNYNFSDKVEELYSSAIAHKLNAEFVKARELLQQALQEVKENTSEAKKLKDELFIELPLSEAREHIKQKDDAKVLPTLQPVLKYLQDHPKRDIYIQHIETLLAKAKNIAAEKKALAEEHKQLLRAAMAQHMLSRRRYPVSQARLESYLEQLPKLRGVFLIRSYRTSGLNYTINFYDTITKSEQTLENS